MTLAAIFCSLLLVCFAHCFPSTNTPVVKTDKGPVVGKLLTTVWHSMEYSAFKGIPFAKPPLGSLRFKPPVEPEPWQLTKTTINEANMCLQTGIMRTIGSEDCLYLNVYTPETKFSADMKLRPVMVWIYGGGFFSGYSISAVYGPDFFLEDDVVYVSLNYRLGPLGFLSLNHSDALGNAGLKDQNLALKWVQKNIAAFGGDPNQVTIFGESAGAAAVGYQVLSEQSKGLFHQAISQSGTPLSPWAFRTPEMIVKHAYDLASQLGLKPANNDELLKSLLATPATAIIDAASALKKPETTLDLLFVPTLENPSLAPAEDIFLSECPLHKYQTGKYNKVPMIMGFNKDEGLQFTFFDVMGDQLMSTALNGVAMNNPMLNRIIKAMMDDARAIIQNTTEYITHAHFVAPTDLTQKLMVQSNGDLPIYYYNLTYETQYQMHKLFDPQINGTAHGDDLGYLFNLPLLFAPTDPEHPFNQFRRSMVSLWTNFVKYGNPTPVGKTDSLDNVEWVPSGPGQLQLNINVPYSMTTPSLSKDTVTFQKALQDDSKNQCKAS